tara:strand:- start:408 stop:1547 length:1140 start_codon:yes stop_codon:yes gene_type:complete
MWFLLSMLVAAPAAGYFGAQYMNPEDPAEAARRQDWLSGMLFERMGFEGVGMYNIVSIFLNLFLPEDRKLEPIDSIDDMMRLADNNDGIRQRMVRELENDVGMPRDLAIAMTDPANRDILDGILAAAGIDGDQLNGFGDLQEQLFSPATLRYILTDDRAAEVVLPTLVQDPEQLENLMNQRTSIAQNDAVLGAIAESLRAGEPVTVESISNNLTPAEKVDALMQSLLAPESEMLNDEQKVQLAENREAIETFLLTVSDDGTRTNIEILEDFRETNPELADTLITQILSMAGSLQSEDAQPMQQIGTLVQAMSTLGATEEEKAAAQAAFQTMEFDQIELPEDIAQTLGVQEVELGEEGTLDTLVNTVANSIGTAPASPER